MRLAVAFIAAMVMLIAQIEAQTATTVTGCINAADKLVNLAVGNQPSEPCNSNEQQVSLQLSTESAPNIIQPINFTLQATPDVQPITLAENGPLNLVAHCRIESGTIELRLEITGGSISDGGFTQVSITAGATESRVLSVEAVGSGRARAVTSADGSFMSIENTTLLAINVFGEDCLIAGAVISF